MVRYLGQRYTLPRDLRSIGLVLLFSTSPFIGGCETTEPSAHNEVHDRSIARSDGQVDARLSDQVNPRMDMNIDSMSPDADVLGDLGVLEA